MVDWPSLIIGAIVGAIATVVVRVRVLAIEEHSQRFDELCSNILDAADLSTDYWLKSGESPDLALFEARLFGYQWRINLILSQLSEVTWYLRNTCETEYDTFSDNLTGGDFQVKGRNADLERAIAVQQTSAQLVHNLRSQRRRILTWQVR